MLVSNAWSLQLNNEIVTSDPHPQILWHLGYRAAYNYMVKKKEFISPTGFPLINFPALSTALKATSPYTGFGSQNLFLATLPLDV